MSTALIDITDEHFDAEVLLSDQSVLIDFWADWCGPCKALVPLLEEVSNKYAGLVKVVKVNVEINPAISKRFAVRGLPTLLLLDDGTEKGRLTGITASRLFTFLNTHLEVELRPDQADAPRVEKPVYTRTFSAFHNDPQLKQAMLQRAALGATAARITGLMNQYSPEQDRGSPIAWLLQTQDVNHIEARLGLPESVASLYEYLFFGLLNREVVDHPLTDEVVAQARPLLHEWLCAIVPGSDLSSLPSRFAAHVTGHILRGEFPPFAAPPAEHIAPLQLLADFHQQAAAGVAQSEATRARVAESVEAISTAYSDSWTQAVGLFATRSVRLQETPGGEIGTATALLIMGYHAALIDAAYSTEELELRQRSITAAAIARQQNPAIDQTTLRALPEYLVWLRAVPRERQGAIELRAGQGVVQLCLQLHRDLISLT